MWKLLLFVFCTPNWWHQRYSQLWHHVVWQICTPISEYLPPPSSGWWRWQAPLRWCYVSTGLQWLDQGDKQHHYHHLENLRSHFIWHLTSPWNLGQNLIWDCKFSYLIVCVNSLIVRVSVNKSEGVIVCLWLRSELLTAVICLPCWDATLCSLVDMCQDFNWAQETKHNS